MQQAWPSLAYIIIRYDAPLQRYAHRLVKDNSIAAALVKEVFEQVYDLNAFDTDELTLRSMFKSHTFKMASCWLLEQSHPKPQPLP